MARLEIDDLDVILREKRLLWFGGVERSNGAIETVCEMQIEGKLGPVRHIMTWKTLTERERDRHGWNLNVDDPCDRDVWRSSVRFVMRAASQLPRGEPTDVDDAPAPASAR